MARSADGNFREFVAPVRSLNLSRSIYPTEKESFLSAPKVILLSLHGCEHPLFQVAVAAVVDVVVVLVVGMVMFRARFRAGGRENDLHNEVEDGGQ